MKISSSKTLLVFFFLFSFFLFSNNGSHHHLQTVLKNNIIMKISSSKTLLAFFGTFIIISRPSWTGNTTVWRSHLAKHCWPSLARSSSPPDRPEQQTQQYEDIIQQGIVGLLWISHLHLQTVLNRKTHRYEALIQYVPSAFFGTVIITSWPS